VSYDTRPKGKLPAPNAPIVGRIAIVGVCATGKSVLAHRLQALGYDARQCAQEHSYIPDMWQRLARCQFLVYLDASLDTIWCRRSTSLNAIYLAEQRRRLEHARAHCQLYLDTSALSEEQVAICVLRALADAGILPHAESDV
jgi:hypothetical protein